MVLNQRLIAQLNSDTDCTLLHVHADDAVCIITNVDHLQNQFFLFGVLCCAGF